MIEVNNLSVGYGDKPILNNLNIKFLQGKITTIIGPNGCGKSTLIKAIAGLFDNTKANIMIDNKLLQQYNRKEFSKKLAFLMQFNDIPEGMTVYELVSFGRLPHKKRFKTLTLKDYEYIDWALAKTNTTALKTKLVSSLSGGEKQRVFLALALAQKTEIILLDEPTNHLDMKYQYELLELIKALRLQENITIICVLHDINQALRYSDQVIVMKHGKIIVQGNPSKCITKEIIHDVYDVNCTIKKIGIHSNVCII